MRLILLVLFTLLCACTSVPDGVQPVTDFQADRYLGRWYEIARLDHPFERGLSRVFAEYTQCVCGIRPRRDDGSIAVVNRGWSDTQQRWKHSESTARFVHSPDIGHLEVSFFGPFYGSYVVFELDRQNYRFALVSGPDKSYLWILARSPTLDAATRERLVARAAAAGFETSQLIFVDQSAKP